MKLVEEEKIIVLFKMIIIFLVCDIVRELGKEICVIDVEGVDVLWK